MSLAKLNPMPNYLRDQATMVFDMLDLDKSGELERSEIIQLFKDNKDKQKGQNVLELFDNMDINQNGIVDK